MGVNLQSHQTGAEVHSVFYDLWGETTGVHELPRDPRSETSHIPRVPCRRLVAQWSGRGIDERTRRGTHPARGHGDDPTTVEVFALPGPFVGPGPLGPQVWSVSEDQILLLPDLDR